MRIILSPLVLCWLMLFMVPTASFAMEESPGFEEITAPETKLMLEKGNAVLVNVLSSLEYELQHIPGSISIPINKLKTSTLLPKSKETALIFYCMGPR